MNSTINVSTKKPSTALLAHGFRPFFLAVGLFGTLVVLAWAAFYLGGWPLPVGWSPLHWHSHEMLFGLVPAAIAGFLLTAITNWTGTKPLVGIPLLLMLMVWAAGRFAMAFADWLPMLFVTLVDMAFLPVLAFYVGTVLLRYKNYRNLILLAVLVLLSVGNLIMHLGFLKQMPELLRLGQQIGFDVITLMMIVVAGRITPAFSANWLRGKGKDASRVNISPLLDRAAIASVALLLLVNCLPVNGEIVGVLAITAGLINLVRLARWGGWHIRSEPLLWVLHLAYAWIVIALLLRGASAFGALAPSVWQHALGTGAIATLILGVMTRVTKGHTGRALSLQPFAVAIYYGITFAALVRVMAALQWIDFRLGVGLAALGWLIAFILFVGLYGGLLIKPRADGRAG